MSMPKPSTIFRVRVCGPTASVRGFLAAHPLEAQSVKFADGTVSVDLFVTERQRQEFERYGLRVEMSFDASERGRERRSEIGTGNRFDGGRLPSGLGIKSR